MSSIRFIMRRNDLMVHISWMPITEKTINSMDVHPNKINLKISSSVITDA